MRTRDLLTARGAGLVPRAESMKELSDTLSSLSQVLTLIVMVGGGIYAFFRGAINEYIKTRLQKAVSSELEEERNKFTREIESLRVSLLRELEQHKANIDLKRTVALKFSETRFESLRKFYAAFDRTTIGCASWSRSDKEVRRISYEEKNKAAVEAQLAHRECEIFLDLDFNREIFSTMRGYLDLSSEFPVDSDNRLEENDERLLALMDRKVNCMSKLRELLYAPPPDLQ